MHVFFSGIGGTAIGPLAQIAKQAGFRVSGSDKRSSEYTDYLKKQGVEDFHIRQTEAQISAVHEKHPIDWLVYSSAVAMEQTDSPELSFCKKHGIKTSKRDEFIAYFLTEMNLQMIAIAGTHGKTTTTAMTIWLFKQLGIPISYSVGAKLSFGEMGHYDETSKYFIYEADEYDRNFLTYEPKLSIITGIDWDHPDIYPTREIYYEAFQQFIQQSELTYLWQDDAIKLKIAQSDSSEIMKKEDYQTSKLLGRVNRENAAITALAAARLLHTDIETCVSALDNFPGISRRFEEIVPRVYSDYAHTPDKIRGALQTALESSEGDVIVVYEGLHNTRQHFIKEELGELFEPAKKVYVVPSYRAREDESLEDLTPAKLAKIISTSAPAEATELNDKLKQSIVDHTAQGDLVLCLSAGGGGSLDEWLRQKFSS